MLTSSPCIFFLFKFSNFLLILFQNSQSFSNREREDLYRETQSLENREFRRRTICSALFGSVGSLDLQSLSATTGPDLGWAYGPFRDIHQPGKPNPTHPTDPKACEWVRTSGRVEKHVLRKIDYSGGCQATRPAQPIQML